MDRVGEQDHPADVLKYQKGTGMTDWPAALGGDPLDQEAPEEARLPEEPTASHAFDGSMPLPHATRFQGQPELC